MIWRCNHSSVHFYKKNKLGQYIRTILYYITTTNFRSLSKEAQSLLHYIIVQQVPNMGVYNWITLKQMQSVLAAAGNITP